MKNPTKAQLERLRQVHENKVTRAVYRMFHMYNVDSSFGSDGTYVMWGNLEDCGFIKWEDKGNKNCIGQKIENAVLTQAGIDALRSKP